MNLQTRKIFAAIGGFIALSMWQIALPNVEAHANQPPVVNAGPDRIIWQPEQWTFLDGSVTDDGLPTGMIFSSWTVLSGPGPVFFERPLNPKTSAQFLSPGMYILMLWGSDGVLSATDTMKVTVNISSPPVNQAPVVNAGPDRIIWQPEQWTFLNGSVTDDGLPVGILISSWTVLSGPGPVIFEDPLDPQTSAQFLTAGMYFLMLYGSDGTLSATDTVKVTVNISSPPINQAPIVNAGPDRFITQPEQWTFLNGSVTDDGLPVGILISSWTVLSGPGPVIFEDPLDPQTSAQFLTAGMYFLMLYGSDGTLSATDTVKVTVNISSPPINQAPIVNAGPDRFITQPEQWTFLNGSVTDDGLPVGILISSWTVLSGPGPVFFERPLNPKTSAQFLSPGMYILMLWGSDGVLSATDTMKVTVNISSPPVNQAPFDDDNVIQPGSKTIIRDSDTAARDAKIVFRTDSAGPVTFYVYERTMGMKSFGVDAIQGNNELLVRDIKSKLNLSFGIYRVTIHQNGKVLKKNIPLALLP